MKSQKIITLLSIGLCSFALAACGQKQATHHHSDSEYSSLKKKNSQLKKKANSQSASNSSSNSQASNKPSQPQLSDEDYAMMAFLKLQAADESPDEAVNNLRTSKDNMHWYPHGNRYTIDFGAHSTSMTVNGDNVDVTFDDIEGDHMGNGNGHRTYTKQELSQEFGKYKDTIDQVLHD